MPARLPFDASDLVSPMLVKELRQGLRSRFFVLTFIAMPLLMGVAVAVWLYSWSEGRGLYDFTEPVFWALAGFPMVAPALPAFFDLRAERREKTYELLLVTTLTPWRILLGKWSSYVARTILITVCVLPFVMIRYFIGGVEPTADLRNLSAILGIAFLVSASGIAVACYRTSFERVFKYGCLGLALAPFFACIIGSLLSLAGWLLWTNSLAAVNGALISLCVLNWAALEVSPGSERTILAVDRRAFRLMAITAICIECGIELPLLHLASLTLLYFTVAALLERQRPAPLFVLAILPVRLRSQTNLVFAAAYVVFSLLWIFSHPLPASSSLIFVSMAGFFIVPWAMLVLLSRWTAGSEGFFLTLFQLAALCISPFLNDFLPAFIPTSALILSLLGAGEPAWLPATAAVTALGAFVIVYHHARRRRAGDDDEDAIVA